MITRIGVNLMFVLALAVGGILTFKFMQKGKWSAKSEPPSDLAGLKIDQVLSVTRGVSLYLVDGLSAKILVAVDAGGIKSVNLMPAHFEDALDDPEAFSRARPEASERVNERASERVNERAVGRASQQADRQPDSRGSQRRGERGGEPSGSKRRLDQSSSSEIDENLIKLLLSKSKEAA
jgi:flagellar biogenesis protein FliO